MSDEGEQPFPPYDESEAPHDIAWRAYAQAKAARRLAERLHKAERGKHRAEMRLPPPGGGPNLATVADINGALDRYEANDEHPLGAAWLAWHEAQLKEDFAQGQYRTLRDQYWEARHGGDS